MIRYKFLGTGTSQGIPVVGCHCEVCRSTDPKDQRLRTSFVVQNEGQNILIDCGPDLRQQLLREGIDNLEGILVTHEHNDHIIGLDDVRPINFKHSKDLSLYSLKRVNDDLIKRFNYIFSGKQYPGIPQVNLKEIDKDSEFEIAGIKIKCLEVMHGDLSILGFIFPKLAYLTDVKSISNIELEKLKDLDYVIMSALHHKLHHSHQNLEEAIVLAKKLPNTKVYLTHFSHFMGSHENINKTLPPNMEMAYDGLEIVI